jgi:hypothetical protein
VRDEADVVRAVLATLARIVAEDDARLTVRSYDPHRRCLTLVLSARSGRGPGPALIREFLVDVLCRHDIQLAELLIESTRL